MAVEGCHFKEDEFSMSVKIRLARYGTKKKPFYRIVVATNEAPRDGRFLELVGTYDPLGDPAPVTLKQDRIKKMKEEMSDTPATIQKNINDLISNGIIHKISPEFVLHSDLYEKLIIDVKNLGKGNSDLTIADFKNMLSLSRKFLIPLLEFLDKQSITVRTQDGNRKVI